jgi:hypothetical protein
MPVSPPWSPHGLVGRTGWTSAKPGCRRPDPRAAGASARQRQVPLLVFATKSPDSRTPCHAVSLAEPLVVDLQVLKSALAGSYRVFQRRNRNRRIPAPNSPPESPGGTLASGKLGQGPNKLILCGGLGDGTISARSWHGLWFGQPEVSCGGFMYHLVNSVQWSAPSKRTTKQLKYCCCTERSGPK